MIHLSEGRPLNLFRNHNVNDQFLSILGLYLNFVTIKASLKSFSEFCVPILISLVVLKPTSKAIAENGVLP